MNVKKGVIGIRYDSGWRGGDAANINEAGGDVKRGGRRTRWVGRE